MFDKVKEIILDQLGLDEDSLNVAQKSAQHNRS
jgi:hypothetical protein